MVKNIQSASSMSGLALRYETTHDHAELHCCDLGLYYLRVAVVHDSAFVIASEGKSVALARFQRLGQGQ